MKQTPTPDRRRASVEQRILYWLLVGLGLLAWLVDEEVARFLAF